MTANNGVELNTITFNDKTFKEFKKLYESCDGETFFFQGREVVKSYAKYLIEFFGPRFK